MIMTNGNLDPEKNESGDLTGEVSKELFYSIDERKQLPKSIIAGIVAMLIGAMVGACITVGIGYQMAYMAVFEGFIVAFTIRTAGKSKDTAFGLLGLILTVSGCILGYYLVQTGTLATRGYMGFFETMQHVSIGLTFRLILDNFNPLDFLCLGVSFYVGYRFSMLSN